MIRVVIGKEPFDVRLSVISDSGVETFISNDDLMLSSIHMSVEAPDDRKLVIETQFFMFEGAFADGEVERIEKIRNLVPRLRSSEQTDEEC